MIDVEQQLRRLPENCPIPASPLEHLRSRARQRRRNQRLIGATAVAVLLVLIVAGVAVAASGSSNPRIRTVGPPATTAPAGPRPTDSGDQGCVPLSPTGGAVASTTTPDSQQIATILERAGATQVLAKEEACTDIRASGTYAGQAFDLRYVPVTPDYIDNVLHQPTATTLGPAGPATSGAGAGPTPTAAPPAALISGLPPGYEGAARHPGYIDGILAIARRGPTRWLGVLFQYLPAPGTPVPSGLTIDQSKTLALALLETGPWRAD